MLKIRDLALRPDMQVGPMLVSPSRRRFEGPHGHVHLQPLVMQAFLLLLDARGKVVTRGELFDQCWGGVTVGDDSLNRAIAKARHAGAKVAPGLFEIETIPRTGYRLTGEILQIPSSEPGSKSGEAAATQTMSRRMLLGGGVATAAVLGGAGLWWTTMDRSDPRVDALLERGEDALRVDDPRAANYFEQAVAIEPGNAPGWGLLAYALASGAEAGTSAVSGRAAQAAERAARTALEIDPDQPDALHAMTMVQSDMLDWMSREERFRQILAIDPENTRVMRSLGQMLHSVGRCRDSLAVVERAIAIEPLSPEHQFRKAMRLWVVGRNADADRVIDRAIELWPSRPLLRMARLMIYAFTGRVQAAIAMVEDGGRTSPRLLSPAIASTWRVSLEALQNRTPSAVAAASKANVDGAKAIPATAAYAILILSALGELDAAFEVANGFLLARGSVIMRPKPTPATAWVNSSGWRNTFGLFTPPTKAMRLDERFKPLADGLGLTEYWRRRGIGPDDFLFAA